jgi:hypothetical protein
MTGFPVTRLERVELVGGEVVYAHHRSECLGPNCSVHHPSAHGMTTFPQHFREDRVLMERVCPHGVGHPDPDDLAYKGLFLSDEEAAAEGIHGCCRDHCCMTTTKEQV